MAAPPTAPDKGDVRIITLHNFDTSICLFAGAQSAANPPAIYCGSAGKIASVAASGTCPLADAALLTALCTDTV